MVNRIWQYHFGQGIVRTPNNFGITGEAPTHPALLDYLASRFVQNGWSVKAMHRMLLLSSAYQMSSKPSPRTLEADPDNRLFSRQSRRRMDFEEIRDGLLALTGELERKLGGTPDTGGMEWTRNGGKASEEPLKSKRRSLYLPIRRSKIPALLALFDFGDATTPGEGRSSTNTAPQALFMINSEWISERSHNYAERFATRASKDSRKVGEAYMEILGRRPVTRETENALRYLGVETAAVPPSKTGRLAELPRADFERVPLCRLTKKSRSFRRGLLQSCLRLLLGLMGLIAEQA
ncbi:MAG: DUF1553 domain-containing protein [Bryobacteraceae bacterium]